MDTQAKTNASSLATPGSSARHAPSWLRSQPRSPSLSGWPGQPEGTAGTGPPTSATSSKYTYSYEEMFYKVSTARALQIVWVSVFKHFG